MHLWHILCITNVKPRPFEDSATHVRHTEKNKGLTGQYANHFRLGFNKAEFVLDFCQQYEGDKDVTCHSRIIIAPEYIHEFKKLLNETLEMHQMHYRE